MMTPPKKPYYTRAGFDAFDPLNDPPPLHQELWCISEHGVGRRGQWNPKTDIAWAPLPKIPASVKDRRRIEMLHGPSAATPISFECICSKKGEPFGPNHADNCPDYFPL